MVEGEHTIEEEIYDGGIEESMFWGEDFLDEGIDVWAGEVGGEVVGVVDSVHFGEEELLFEGPWSLVLGGV